MSFTTSKMFGSVKERVCEFVGFPLIFGFQCDVCVEERSISVFSVSSQTLDSPSQSFGERVSIDEMYSSLICFLSFLPSHYFFLLAVINGEQAALSAPVFLEKTKRTRSVLLTDMVETSLAEIQKK